MKPNERIYENWKEIEVKEIWMEIEGYKLGENKIRKQLKSVISSTWKPVIKNIIIKYMPLKNK